MKHRVEKHRVERIMEWLVVRRTRKSMERLVSDSSRTERLPRMAKTNEELAQEIADITSLSCDEALRALKEGGEARNLALSILEDAKRHDQSQRSMTAARRRLRQTAI